MKKIYSKLDEKSLDSECFEGDLVEVSDTGTCSR